MANNRVLEIYNDSGTTLQVLCDGKKVVLIVNESTSFTDAMMIDLNKNDVEELIKELENLKKLL